ncbi:MAG: 2Fe-2S iron-sulfur cluster binding domain-containing protein, partial [Salinisphaera sp.]|nr:2Fe-2S iron-sulfur cluster binding domain-containing protein [Salinisphaera sp.]
GTEFGVGNKDLLLMAAIQQGIDYPHNCRVGTCATCKTRLISGKIRPLVDFALSPLTNQELKDGYILACQSKVMTDLVVDVHLGEHVMIPYRATAARVCGWRRLPGEVIDLRLRMEAPFPYLAGQYCLLAESGSYVRRAFSFYDAPPDPDGQGAQELGFLIKRLPGGAFSEWLYAKDRSGTKFWVHGPQGRMGLDDVDRDAICVAGSTGIAPILSIIADRLQRSASARFTVVFGVRTAADLFAMDKLEALEQSAPGRVRVLPILSHEPPRSDWTGRRGLVTDAIDELLGIDYFETAAFICGNLPMVEAVESRLLQLGVEEERIHADKFIPTGL